MAEYAPDFPQYISSPIQILWWEMDQIVIAALSCTAAILQRGIIPWIAFIAVQLIYAKAKKNRPRGFMQHVLYMLGMSKIQHYPEYFNQEYHE